MLDGKGSYRQERGWKTTLIPLDDPRLAGTGELAKAWRSLLSQDRWEVSLTFDEYEAIFNSQCAYCGRTRDECKPTAAMWVDRADNHKPYSLENSRPCCPTCNFSKFKQSGAEYVAHCIRVAARAGMGWVE